MTRKVVTASNCSTDNAFSGFRSHLGHWKKAFKNNTLLKMFISEYTSEKDTEY